MAMIPLQIPGEIALYKRTLTREDRRFLVQKIKSGLTAGQAFYDLLKEQGVQIDPELDRKYSRGEDALDEAPF